MPLNLNLQTIADVAEACYIPQAKLEKLLVNPGKYYSAFPITKPNGDIRVINPSFGVLKRAQTWLLDHFNARVVWSKAVHGGIKKRSIFTNATPHIGKFCVATMDIAAFFPSTKSDQIVEALMALDCGLEASKCIAHLATYKGVLPQGAPTSTLMGNLALRRMDYQFIKIAQEHRLSYTRYIDDITISGPVRLDSFKTTFSDFVVHAGFRLSPKKTQIRYRNEPQIVTGLLVNDKLRPATTYLSDLRKTIRGCWPGETGAEALAASEGLTLHQFKESLWGKINFVGSINPRLFQKLRGLMVNAVLEEKSSNPIFVETQDN